jgi:hypothetical protein
LRRLGRIRFWPQNFLEMANTINNWISLNLKKKLNK